MSEETDHREDHQAREEGRPDVADRDDQRVLVAVVGEFVVRAQCNQASPGWTQGKEDLHRGVSPHFRGHQSLPVGSQVEEYPFAGARKYNTSYEKRDLQKRRFRLIKTRRILYKTLSVKRKRKYN